MKSVQRIRLVYFPVNLLGQEKIHFQDINNQRKQNIFFVLLVGVQTSTKLSNCHINGNFLNKKTKLTNTHVSNETFHCIQNKILQVIILINKIN